MEKDVKVETQIDLIAPENHIRVIDSALDALRRMWQDDDEQDFVVEDV